MHLPLGEPQPPDPDDIGNQLDKERRFLERVGLLVQDLLVRLETGDQHGIRVAHVEVADQVGAGPFLHPRDEGLVGVAAAELVEGLAYQGVVVLLVC